MFYLILLLISNCTFSQQNNHFVQHKEAIISVDEKLLIVTIPFEVLADYHIQSNVVSNGNFVATNLQFDQQLKEAVVSQEFIIQQAHRLLLGKDELEVLKAFSVKVTLDKKKLKGIQTLEGILFYQACNTKKCFFPRELLLKIPM